MTESRRGDAGSAAGELIARIREFNRDYTRLIGALDYGRRLNTPYSLPQARVLYELARRDQTPLAELRRELEMDPGQLSRLLGRAEEDGLVVRERDPADSRRQLIRLTGTGRKAAALLDTRAEDEVAALVRPLSAPERERLTVALRTVSRLLGPGRPGAPRFGGAGPGFRLRPPGPGELGWVIARHGALYAAEYGWNDAFEALVADVVARFARHRDPAREAAWIAELDGEPAGCVFCVDEAAEHEVAVPTARLRLLLVEPRARGLGMGRALVDECLGFARRAGYQRMVLWTNDVLGSARRIYESCGFTLVATAPHTLFGRPENGQDWALDLV
ncbi:bifunctional helix-turn-helix transcriptional regulator/GNAT family N-acetyltransferase [Streptomyces sp. B6B3]|uniref:bifunctional helix-turn-helix transcriptional regulator/GNAT family N-acetyltransferase n=1 Tax=Streptomyces sp. B6B3 TaxID=3153570 RepID=UPI00325F3E9C